jgi:hypothetical protein
MNTAEPENLANSRAMEEEAPNLGSTGILVDLLKLASMSCKAFVNEAAAKTFTGLCCADALHSELATNAIASKIRII